MFRASPAYSPLTYDNKDASVRESLETRRCLLSNEEKNLACTEGQARPSWQKADDTSRKWLRVCCSILAISMVMNVVLLIRMWQWCGSILYNPLEAHEQPTGVLPVSDFARLEFDQLDPWVHYSPYADTNLTAAGDLWDAIDFDSGFIALDYDYAAAKKLPKSQPFPWDDTKGIYLINAYHSLHCLKSIHQFIRESELGTEKSFPIEHITHCLDSLRKEAICTADDTPRWTSSAPEAFLESGVGQQRQCRDFSKLEAWAKDRHSCYNRIDERHQCISQFELYKFCPKGSPYENKMRQFFKVVMGRILPDVVEKKGKPGMCDMAKDVLSGGDEHENLGYSEGSGSEKLHE